MILKFTDEEAKLLNAFVQQALSLTWHDRTFRLNGKDQKSKLNDAQRTKLHEICDRLRMIHWTSTPKGVCKRKDFKVDDGPFVQGRDKLGKSKGSGYGSFSMAEASHTENVTCPTCRRHLRKKFPRAKLFVPWWPEARE